MAEQRLLKRNGNRYRINFFLFNHPMRGTKWKKVGTHLLTLSYLAHFGREMVMTTEIVTYPNRKCLVGVWCNFKYGSPGPTWANLNAPNGPKDMWNRQILMQILILHTMIGLQTKFEANRTNNGQNIAFSAFWTASPPGPSYWANLAYLFFFCQVLLEE